jgi:hypothetical protein
MNTDSMYIIRYPLVPEEPRQKRLELLLQFCRDAKLDEVMFFVMPEEYNRGAWRKSDYQPWLDFAAEARHIVEREGYRTSLNLWHTILHTDRGRRSEDVKFRRMVNDDGYQNLSVGCPICPDWQKLWLDTFADGAKAGFKTLWIEDDFRFHNHSGHGWGGCFCDEHIKVLQQRGIVAKNREELVANLNAKDIVHPDRKIWQTFNAETYIDLAKKMRNKMDQIDPNITLGLMASYIPVHTQEGRDWYGLIDALSGKNRAVVRPHAASYQEAGPRGFFFSFGNLSQTFGVLPKGTKTFFEIENCPMSRFAKSNHQTRMQMAAVIDGGCDGLTFDVLDFLGTGPASEPGMAPMLSGAKDKMLRIRDLAAQTTQLGVQAIVPADTTKFAPGNGKPEVGNLPTAYYGWFVYLGGFGIPCINVPTVPEIDTSKIYALAGDAVAGLSDEQLKKVLSTATILLDADAADRIFHRGLGNLIGLEKTTRRDREEDIFAFEENLTRDSDDIPQRASLNLPQKNFCVNFYELTRFAQARTVVKDCFLNVMGVGSFTYKNTSGGKGLVLPHDVPAVELSPHSWIRKAWIDQWLDELAGEVTMPQLIDGAWVHLSARSGDRVKTIFLANQMYEVYSSISIRLPQNMTNLKWTLDMHARDKSGSVKLNGDVLTVETDFVGNDWLVLKGQ